MDHSCTCFCTSAEGKVKVTAWDLRSGVLVKSYALHGAEVEDRANCICTIGNEILLSSLQTKPFICYWDIKKVTIPLSLVINQAFI